MLIISDISTSQIGWIFVYCFLMKNLSGGNKKDLNLIWFDFSFYKAFRFQSVSAHARAEEEGVLHK